MRFVGRNKELRELKELERLSKKKLFVAALYGLRRVGKTRLLLEFLKNRGLYFFVNKNKTPANLLGEYQQILKENRVIGELESLDSWDKFIEVLIKRNPSVAVFDEFQNFHFVEPAVFGDLQKNIDLNENRQGLILFCGSLVGLMKKIFQDAKEPLYGRIKKGIRLEPLSLADCLRLGKELKLAKEDLVKLHGVFGGYPKYYVAIEDFSLQNTKAEQIIDSLFLAKNAPLEDEVNAVLSQEFGKRSGVYYSILEAVATGNNTLSAIAGYQNKPTTSITRQVNELKDHFELITHEKPFRGKRGIYRIKHPLMQFWFSAIYRHHSDYVSRNPVFISKAKKNLNSVFAKGFERTATEFVVSKLGVTDAKRQWGKIPQAKKGKNAYEIDLMATKNNASYIFEFKWKEMRVKEAIQTIENLQKKTKHVPRLPPNARFGIVAKKIKEKQKIRAAGHLAYDIRDF